MSRQRHCAGVDKLVEIALVSAISSARRPTTTSGGGDNEIGVASQPNRRRSSESYRWQQYALESKDRSAAVQRLVFQVNFTRFEFEQLIRLQKALQKRLLRDRFERRTIVDSVYAE